MRYADDCNIYVGSQAAAERVRESITRWIEKRLRLRVNQTKSGAGPTPGRKILGFSLNAEGKIEVAARSVERFKEKVRELWKEKQQGSNEQLREQWNRYVRGWSQYFGLAEEVEWMSAAEGWVRRHIRKYYWQRWHNAKGRLNAFRRLGLSWKQWPTARSSRGAWCMAGSPAMQAALSNRTLNRYRYLMPSMLWAH